MKEFVDLAVLDFLTVVSLEFSLKPATLASTFSWLSSFFSTKVAKIAWYTTRASGAYRSPA